jgi:ATP-dependent DNA helicase DinG
MCGRLKDELHELFFSAAEGYFKWGERSTGRKVTNCFLRNSPLTVAELLPDLLWKEMDSAVLTSATLTNAGSFKYIRSRLGISDTDEVIEDSPFDFQKQCLMYIPKHLEFPSESRSYLENVANEIEQIVLASGGRAFLLFTSYRMMNAVYDSLLGRLPYVLMKQGDMSNEELVSEFMRQSNACLFGVHSFWEGVDIRGEVLSCVVIDKLPFAVPKHPVYRARTDAIVSGGGDGFSEYAMPQAQIRLKQGFGRLIRTKTDWGVVAILDSRLLRKSYGKAFLRCLPRCPITAKIDIVRSFYRNGGFDSNTEG